MHVWAVQRAGAYFFAILYYFDEGKVCMVHISVIGIRTGGQHHSINDRGSSPAVRTMAVRSCQRRERSSSAIQIVSTTPRPAPPPPDTQLTFRF